jgi:aryl-alcohol dehydrogenase-like predicted oxidoreductase
MPVGSRLTEVEKAGENRFLDPHWDTIDALKAFAEKRGHTILELAFSWLAQRPLVSSIIAGATKPEQLQVNATAVNWKLSAEEMAEVDRIVPAKLAA